MPPKLMLGTKRSLRSNRSRSAPPGWSTRRTAASKSDSASPRKNVHWDSTVNGLDDSDIHGNSLQGDGNGLQEKRASDYDDEIRQQFEREMQPLIPGHMLPEVSRPVSLALCALSSEDDNGKDLAVCKGIASLMQALQDFAQKSQRTSDTAPLRAKRAFMDQILALENARLARYIGYLATAGPKGLDSWAELLADTESRRALIIGILGHALKAKVFDAVWFGGDEMQKRTLLQMDVDRLGYDGFLRTTERAETISKFVDMDSHKVHLRRASAELTLQLESLIAPLWKLVDLPSSRADNEMRHDLQHIVDQAVVLSRAMRQAGDVIYHFTRVFKDEQFEPAHMDCLNLTSMILQSPYEKVTINGNSRVVERPAHSGRSEALVRIVCFPGIVAYRRGGGSLARAEIDAARKRDHRDVPPDVQQAWRSGGRDATDKDGYRTKVICNPVVFLHWGQQRLLAREAGTSAHIDARQEARTGKYDKDYQGFTEFFDMWIEKWSSSVEKPGKAR